VNPSHARSPLGAQQLLASDQQPLLLSLRLQTEKTLHLFPSRKVEATKEKEKTHLETLVECEDTIFWKK
jgi:hypothetical protein